MYFDLHRHDHFSLFDGFNKAEETAAQAKELGYKALGIANHGNVNGLVQHYFSCRNEGIKPILGVEAYLQPKLKEKSKERYHLCIFAKNIKGYSNMNRLMRISEEQMYYKPLISFKNLEEINEGLIVTSACVGGPISQLIANGKVSTAEKVAKKLHNIFGDDFYLEIQPYVLSEEGLQEKVNIGLVKLSKKLGVKLIITSDSHYSKKDEWESYKKMHEISSPEFDAEATYGERYMPSEKEIRTRYAKMHGNGKYAIPNYREVFKEAMQNLDGLQESVDGEILEKLPMKLPEFIEGKNSYKKLEEDVKAGLKKRGKCTKEYIKRCKEELDVIKSHGFSDYFLIVADYVNWAKEQGIAVGPGRGSVCNSQVAWALGITDVDSLKFKLDFRRFLRYDKKKIPDIDLDFETCRRQEVIDYIIEKYDGHAAQIRSYGLYKVDNLINDLAKVCGIEEKETIKRVKTIVNQKITDGELDIEGLRNHKHFNEMNEEYENIFEHFIMMYKKIKYIGTHAAGVAITGGKIDDYVALKLDKKTGKLFTAFDLTDLEKINVVKFDILGLNTMEQIRCLRDLTGKRIEESWFEDKKIFEQFGEGNTDGIFQFERDTAKKILRDIHCDCFEDVIAASSMNRPGPLSMKMPEQYAHNKFNVDDIVDSMYYEYTEESYGTIVYQEQIQQICINIGKMDWQEADNIMKFLKGGQMTTEALRRYNQEKDVLKNKFVIGAMQNGMKKDEAESLFESMIVYSFNKGHATGYSIISVEEMYYKTYYPTEYWYVKCKYAPGENDLFRYKSNASSNGILLFMPHVNYTSDFSLRKIEGEYVIQEGLTSIKFVGGKAAEFIENERRKNGIYTSLDNFLERTQVKGSGVNKRVVEQLLENGALEFNKNIYLKRVTKYNSTLYSRSV